MKKTVFCILSVCLAGMLICLFSSTPAIKEIKIKSEEITIHVGQIKEVVEDLCPDPAFTRLKVTSDSSCVEVQKDKFSIKGISDGTATVTFYDRNKELVRIKVTVLP